MQANTSPRTSQPHPRLPSSNSERTDNIENTKSSSKHSVRRGRVTNGDMAAAQILTNLRQESTSVLRRLMKAHNNRTGDAVKAILDHAIRNPSEGEPTKAIRLPAREERVTYNVDNQVRLDAALTLVELSGRSRAESEAALGLLSLRRDSDSAILDAQRSQNSLARMTEQRMEKEKSLALRKFREQYPAVLRTSMWRSGSGWKVDDVVLRR